MTPPQLERIFRDINYIAFDNELMEPYIVAVDLKDRGWNGEFIPQIKINYQDLDDVQIIKHTPRIEIARHLSPPEAFDTMLHEMVHYWQWMQDIKLEHGGAFWEELHKRKLLTDTKKSFIMSAQPLLWVA